MEAKVSVVIVNWNGAEHLRLCLPTLASQSCRPYETVVVDNGSSDGSEQVALSFGCKWVGLKQNIGLAPALNHGAAAAAGDFLLFVNNDMRFHPGFVESLLNPLISDPTLFGTDGMQFDWEGATPAHTATRLSKSPSNGDSSMELVPGLYSYQTNVRETTPAFMASAACMMVRRSAFERLGGFDRRLPLGYEDTELCWRAWVRGWKVVYVPQAICWHRVGASGKSKQGARFNFRGIVRGRLLLSTKLLPARYTFLTWIVSAAALGKDLAGAHFRRAADRLSILWQTAQLVPQLLRERRELFRQSNTSPREQLDRLLRLPR